MLALDADTVLALSPTVLLRSLPDQGWYFAFDVESGDQFRLNRTSFWILETIGSSVTWSELRSQFAKTFDVGPEAEADLWAVVSQLCEERVIRRPPDGEAGA